MARRLVYDRLMIALEACEFLASRRTFESVTGPSLRHLADQAEALHQAIRQAISRGRPVPPRPRVSR